jgi:hypothetical protein
MARRKRIVLEGPAAEAVELLARSAGITPAELVKRALLREEAAQRAPEAPAQSFTQRVVDGLKRANAEEPALLVQALNPQDWPASEPTLSALRAAAGLAHDPELAVNQFGGPGFRYVLALDANHTLHAIGPSGDLEIRKSPAVDREAFAGLAHHLRQELAEHIQETTDIATVQAQLSGLERPIHLIAFSTRATFSQIVTLINDYFAARGFTDKIARYSPPQEDAKQTGSAERKSGTDPRL